MQIEDKSDYQKHVYSVKKETAKRLMEIKKKFNWRIEAIVNEAFEDWIKKIEEEFKLK
ncbi:MAG: hypothetical protein J6Q61_00605 [Bacteroidales bacterium]|nr:hypothetical protein [Bacteroidales bacterium]